MTILRTDFARAFLINGGYSPSNVPEYEGQVMVDGVTWKQGDVKPQRDPSPNQLGVFINIGEIPGDQGNPEMKTSWRYTYELSQLLAIIDLSCPVDIQVHMGECQNPQDFNGGWNKVSILENARPTDYTLDKMTALQPADRAAIMESAPFSGADFYEVGPQVFAEQAKVQVIQEVIDIAVCDTAQCGNCGLPSDGCQTVFAVSLSHAGSPGLPAEVLFTTTGGSTWGTTHITASALPANDNPSAVACVGSNLIVVSSEGLRYVYASLASILAGTDSWTAVTAGGIVAGGEPNCIFSLGPNLTWFGGLGGYIYFSADPTSSVTVQDAAQANATQYNAVHGFDQFNLLAVGNTNAVAYTVNGGATWQAVTGPHVATNLNCCFMLSQNIWYVGDASGKLWYTENSGLSWTEKPFPGSGTGSVLDITFGYQGNRQSVGYMSHRTAATPNVGRILRTISGGNSWYVAPEGNATMPTNQRINALAACRNVNVIYGAGLAAGVSTDGIIVKGQA